MSTTAVTVAAAVLAIVVIATFLVGIAMVLSRLQSRMQELITALSAISRSTEPVGPAVSSINRDLGAANEVLESVLEHKAGGTPRSDRSPRRSS